MRTAGTRLARTAMSGVLALVLAGGMTACGGGGGGKLTADVTMDSTHRFSPSTLDISLNEDGTFTFANRDNTVHNITVPGLSNDVEQNAIDVDVAPGQRGTVKLPKITTAPRDGFFLFYCKYHQTEGMAGRFKISK